jgi:hypothetical protein
MRIVWLTMCQCSQYYGSSGAEWQDPRFPTHPKPTAHAIATGNISHVDNLDDEQQCNEINLEGLDSVLDALTMEHEGQQLLVLPNSLATHRSFVRMAINQHAAELAANNPAIGNMWFEDIIPSCFGSLGAVNGWDLGKDIHGHPESCSPIRWSMASTPS